MTWHRCAVCGRTIGTHTNNQIQKCRKHPRWEATWDNLKVTTPPITKRKGKS